VDNEQYRGQRKVVAHIPSNETISTTVGKLIIGLSEKRGEPEFKTGLEVVDKGLFGLHRKMLTVLAARAGQGKTSMACNMAFHLADSGTKVAMASLEMARENIVTKLFCAENKVDTFRFMIGAITKEEKNRLEVFKKAVEKLPLRIIDDFCFTQDEIYTLFDHLDFKPDVFIVDHLQHIRSTNRLSDRENLTEYLRFLKETSMRHNIAVVVLSQVNREGDEKPTLKNLKGTGAIEEMADHVLFLSLTEKSSQFGSIKDTVSEASVEIAKNRLGPKGYFLLHFNGSHGKFHNIEKYMTEPDKAEIESR